MKPAVNRALALCLAIVLALSVLSGCRPRPDVKVGEHELTLGMQELPSVLNPHALRTEEEGFLFDLLSSALVSVTVKNSAEQSFQWVYELADSVTDVTQLHTEDLEKYAVRLPYGVSSSEITRGYVYEIRLNPSARWEDGTSITADDYIASMKYLLDPEMKNSRAVSFCSGSAALAGALEYYSFEFHELENYTNASYALADLVKGEDGIYTTPEGYEIFIATQDGLRFLDDYSLQTFVDYYGYLYFDVSAYRSLIALADEKGRVPVTDESLALLQQVITKSERWGDSAEDACFYLIYSQPTERFEYEDTVGLYKADSYTIRYVTREYTDLPYFLEACTRSFLVPAELYESGRRYSENQLFVTDYGTSKSSFLSCGPYRLEKMNEQEIVLVQNENWYGWQKKDGFLVSYTAAEIDGEYRQQYETTRLTLKKMTAEEQKEAFEKGELSLLTLCGAETAPKGSKLYTVPEGGVRSLFFNSSLKALQKLDRSGNENSVVLSNDAFRRALSLSLDRVRLAETAGGKAALGLMSDEFFYDLFNDPASSYRGSAEAGKISELYRDEASEWFARALSELTAAGLYQRGSDIKIRVAWSEGELDENDLALAALLSEQISASAASAGFGRITLEPAGNAAARYRAVPEGAYAAGFGAWEGGFLSPFLHMQQYLDPEAYPNRIAELGCWNPAEEQLSLTVDGSEITMSCQDWSRALSGDGRFANAPNGTKLLITAALERAFLEKAYRIPLYSPYERIAVNGTLHYYTDQYSLMYGFGGIRLLSYE